MMVTISIYQFDDSYKKIMGTGNEYDYLTNCGISTQITT